MHPCLRQTGHHKGMRDMVRNLFLALALALPAASPVAALSAPPADVGPGLQPVDGHGPVPRPCPSNGSVVRRRPLPAIEYLGVTGGHPDLCHVRIGGTELDLWYGIWSPAWPGADAARPALKRAFEGPTGVDMTFDTHMAPGLQWHELIRNEGMETLHVGNQSRPAIKIIHYREGFDGNSYRSVATAWKDIASGMIIYVNYRHISGSPEPNIAFDPTEIIEAP